MLDQVLFMSCDTLIDNIVKECKKHEQYMKDGTDLYTGWSTYYDVYLDTIYIYHHGQEVMNNIDLQRIGLSEWVSDIDRGK